MPLYTDVLLRIDPEKFVQRDLSDSKTLFTLYQILEHFVEKIFYEEGLETLLPKCEALLAILVDALKAQTLHAKHLIRVTRTKQSPTSHAVDVLFFALLLGHALKLEKTALLDLCLAALLHDIGQCNIAHCITNKEGKLSESEFEVMKRHVLYGCENLRNHPRINGTILNAIRHHHEKNDGTGYPDGLKGESIPLYARILTITDIFAALTTERGFGKKYRSLEAIEHLRAMKGAIDQTLLGHFIKALLD